jgi:hypothetical protein
MIGYEVEIGSELPHIGQLIETEFNEALDLIAPLLRDEWKGQALETKSYLSGDYYRNIHVQGHEIISDIGYGQIIEDIGWPTQGPRFPAERAIERANPDIEKILTDAADRVIDVIES